jgi:hypothetical protein
VEVSFVGGERWWREGDRRERNGKGMRADLELAVQHLLDVAGLTSRDASTGSSGRRVIVRDIGASLGSDDVGIYEGKDDQQGEREREEEREKGEGTNSKRQGRG